MKNVTKTVGRYLTDKFSAIRNTFSNGMVNYDSPENRIYRKLSRQEGRMLLSEQKRTSGILDFADREAEMILC